jgi:hypothetical protein
VQRRHALRLLAATAALSPAELFALGRRAHAQDFSLRAIDAEAERLLGAAAELILPGALEASVPRFIDAMLADWYPAEERNEFLLGIRALRDRGFAEAAADARTEILSELDAQATEDDWFSMLKFLTMWGYFTSEAGERALGTRVAFRRFEGCVKR